MALTAELPNTRTLTLQTNGGVVQPVVGVGPQGAPGPGSAAWTALEAVTAATVRQAPDGSYIRATTSRTTRATFDATEQGFWAPVLATAGTLENLALLASFVPKWAATTTYLATTLVLAPDGKVIQRNADGTSRATYDATEQAAWTVVSGSTLDAVARTTRPQHAPALGLFFPEAEGAVGDGTHDDTAAVIAAAAACQAAGTGRVYLDGAKTYRCDGQLAIPYTGGATPVQKPVRITSPGTVTNNGRWTSNPLNGGATLDLRYPGRVATATVTSGSATVLDASITALDTGVRVASGANIPAGTYVGTVTPGVSFKLSSSPTSQVDVLATGNGASVTIDLPKIDTRGAGLLEIDHVNLISGGSDDNTFLRTTNTTIHVHHCYVQGNLSKTGTNCKQDAFVLGGLTATIGQGASAPFQGYGSKIHDNYFAHIRRGFVGRSYCNSIAVENNTFSTSCGNDGTTSGTAANGDWTMGAAIEFTGNANAGFTVGNITRGNTIECNNYKFGVAASWANRCTFGPDGIWDPSGPYVAAHFFDTTATYNVVQEGYCNDLYPMVLDYGLANKVNTNAQARASYQSQATIISAPTNPQVHAVTGWHTVATSGDAAAMKVSAGTAATPSYPEAILTTIAGTTITDLVTDTTTRTVSSATAAWTRQHQYAPIKGTGIPSGTKIVRYIDATHVELSAFPTATASGVTAQFGTGTTGGGTSRDELGVSRGGHLIPKGAIGAAAAPPAAIGTSGNGAAVSAVGKDTAFVLTVTTASTGTGIGTMATVAWGVAFTGSAGVPGLTAMNQAAAEAMATNRIWAAPTNSNFVLVSGVGTLPVSTTMIFGVHMMQS